MFAGEASHSILACLFPALVQESTNKFPLQIECSGIQVQKPVSCAIAEMGFISATENKVNY